MPAKMIENIIFMTLEYNMNTQHEIYRMDKDSVLRFQIGSTLLGKRLRIFTNYPIKADNYIRNKYYELEIINPQKINNKLDSFDNYTEIQVTKSGSYYFFITENGVDSVNDKIGEGYFIVNTKFAFPHDGNKNYELEGLALQTYLGKNLGPFNEWRSRMSVTINSKYNMIHFTPLQELGYSQSAYSLKDQLKVNSAFSTSTKTVNWGDIEDFVNELLNEHNILSMTDLVYNHTAFNSPWILEHPECAYNVVNSPNLRPAYLVDRLIWNLSIDIQDNKYLDSHGLGKNINAHWQMDKIRNILWNNLNSLRIHEFYVAHVDREVEKFRNYLSILKPDNEFKSGDLKLIHGNYKRLESTVDFDIAADKFYKNNRNIDDACAMFASCLWELNEDKCHQINQNLETAVGNVMSNTEFRFIDPNGLRLGEVGENTPLMWYYFHHQSDVKSLDDCEALMDSGDESLMAFNGWVMGDDGLKNFAEEGSDVYLRRELVVWTDSVKLRFGNGAEDCPYLWDKMFKYTEITAKIFHGIRLDNCHSTPIHVCQAMIDRARTIRPDIYIVAELFTCSDRLDNYFVNKLGLNGLIREVQAAKNSQEQANLIRHYSGALPPGSFVHASLGRKLLPSSSDILFFDMTHDNLSPVATRSPFDLLPSAALTAASFCAIGSARGYDELVPHYIDVAKDTRLYATYDNIDQCGLLKCRHILNSLHKRLAIENYTEVFIGQENDVIAVTRNCPATMKSVIVISHTSFRYPGHTPSHRHLNPLLVNGHITQILAELSTYRDLNQVDDYKPSETIINGLPGIWVNIDENTIGNPRMIQINHNQTTGQDTVNFINFPQGSVVILEIDMMPDQYKSVQDVYNVMAKEFGTKLIWKNSGNCLNVNE